MRAAVGPEHRARGIGAEAQRAARVAEVQLGAHPEEHPPLPAKGAGNGAAELAAAGQQLGVTGVVYRQPVGLRRVVQHLALVAAAGRDAIGHLGREDKLRALRYGPLHHRADRGQVVLRLVAAGQLQEGRAHRISPVASDRACPRVPAHKARRSRRHASLR